MKMLVQELNKAYQYELDGAVFMLSRKFIENLLSQFYLEHFPERKAHYDDNRGQFKSLGKLKSQLESDLEEFQKYTPVMNREMIQTIGRVQTAGNTHTHSADVIYRQRDLIELQNDIGDIIEAVNTLESKIPE
jgi:hypothetical protein